MIFIHDLSPEVINFGPIVISWYGLLLGIGIILSYLLIGWIFKWEGYPVSHLESVLIYSVVGAVIGARLGEVIFYDPGYYFKNPMEIVKIWKGGMSSHGAAIGLFLSYLIWTKIHRIPFNRYVDSLVHGIPIPATFVRIGNFFNSEIVGIPTSGNWGVIFKRLGEDFPRHPAQLYEAVLNIFILITLHLVYRKYYRKTPHLFFMFLYVLLYFAGRFIIELWKDLHVLPEWSPLSMGQVLSIFPILISIVYFALIFPGQEKIRVD